MTLVISCMLFLSTPAALRNLLRISVFQNGPRRLVRIKKWFLDVLETLDNLHKTELCQIDLKTDNILIS